MPLPSSPARSGGSSSSSSGAAAAAAALPLPGPPRAVRPTPLAPPPVPVRGAMSFKPENLVRATTIERLKARGRMALHRTRQLANDPNTKEQLRRLYTTIDVRLPPSIKPEHAAIALLLAWLILIRIVGFAKMVLLSSAVMILARIVAPDLASGTTDVKVLVSNVPKRAREAFVQMTGYSGVTERQCVIVLGVFMLVVIKLLLTSSSSGVGANVGGPDLTSAGAPPVPVPLAQQTRSLHGTLNVEEAYRLGYEDARDGLDFGSSMPKAGAAAASSAADIDINLPPYDPTPLPAAHSESKFGIMWVFSAFALFRGIKEAGVTPDGRFDPQFLMANVKMLPPLKLAMLAFCSYRVFSAFF